MIVAIHQPNFIPWIGYFYKISKADVFVFLDNVQYIKRSYINRNKIKCPNGELWLTIPVSQKGKYDQLIKDVEIITPEINFKKILSTIKRNYSRAIYFSKLYPLLESLLATNEIYLSSINILLIKKIADYLNLKTKFIKESSLSDISGMSTERLVSICKNLGATKYISGFGGNKYQDIGMFNDAGIICETYDFVHPVYHQLWGDFISNLSVIDFLFNEHPEKILLNRGYKTIQF